MSYGHVLSLSSCFPHLGVRPFQEAFLSEVVCWNLLKEALNWGNLESSGWKSIILVMSDTNAALDISKSARRANRLLVRSSFMISQSLTNVAMRVQARVLSTSCMLSNSCMDWRWRAWTWSKISWVVFMTCSLLGAVSVGSTLPLSLVSGSAGGSLLLDSSGWDASASFDSSSWVWSNFWASHFCQDFFNLEGKIWSETTLQWSFAGGWKFIPIFGFCTRSIGKFSSSYTSKDELISPKRWGKATWWIMSSPGGCVWRVWSLNPLRERGDTGSSPPPTIVSLDAKSSKMGCQTATGRMPLISDSHLTNRRRGPSNLLSDSSSEAAECHSFKCM